MALRAYLRSHHHTQGHLGFLLCDPFWISFCEECKMLFFLFLSFLACSCPVVPGANAEKTAPLYRLAPPWKISDYISVGLFLGSLFSSVDPLVSSFTNPILSYILYLYNKSWSQGNVSSPTLFFSFSTVLVFGVFCISIYILESAFNTSPYFESNISI